MCTKVTIYLNLKRTEIEKVTSSPLLFSFLEFKK